MINNFEQIKSLLTFNNPDEFYFCQIIKRKKDNPECKSTHKIKSYYFNTLESINKAEKEIIDFCNFTNSRAYITLSAKSFKKVSFLLLNRVSEYLLQGDFKSIKNAYDSACGTLNANNSKY